MRRAWIAAAAITFLPTLADTVVVRRAGAPPASGCDTTDKTFWWRLEGATLDGTLDHTAGDSTASLTGATIDAGDPKMGTNGLTSPGGSTNTYALFNIVSRDIASDVSGTASFWVKWASGGTLPANETDFHILEVGSSSSDKFTVSLVSDGSTGFKVRAKYRASGSDQATITSSGVEIVSGTYYHIRLQWDTSQAGGSDVFKLYVDNSLKAGDAVQTIAPFAVGPEHITLGMQYMVAPLVTPMYFDQLIISSDHADDLFECSTETDFILP